MDVQENTKDKKRAHLKLTTFYCLIAKLNVREFYVQGQTQKMPYPPCFNSVNGLKGGRNWEERCFVESISWPLRICSEERNTLGRRGSRLEPGRLRHPCLSTWGEKDFPGGTQTLEEVTFPIYDRESPGASQPLGQAEELMGLSGEQKQES